MNDSSNSNRDKNQDTVKEAPPYPPTRNAHSVDNKAVVDSSERIVALLSATVPQVDEQFRRNLEERLLNKLQTRQADEADNAVASALPHVSREGAANLYRLQGQQERLSAPVSWLRRRAGRAASLFMGALVVALLVLLLVGFSALLQSRQVRGGGPNALSLTPSVTAGSGDEAQYLFSVPLGKANTRPLIAGFGVEEDGTFWIIDQGKRLQHYSATGKALGDLDLSSHLDMVYDMEPFSNTVWIYDGTYVIQLAPDGSTVHAYSPFGAQTGLSAHQPPPLGSSEILRPEGGGEGRMLLEAGYYYRVVADQTMTANGQLNPQPIPGYPAYGKIYRVVEGHPNIILAGDVQVEVSIPEQISDLHVFKVMPDGSFFVLVDAVVPASGGLQSTVRQYVMHYAANGTLIERARVPAITAPQVAVKQIAAATDGTFYIARLSFDQNGVPAEHADILRLNFYPAAVPLPPTSTPISFPTIPPPAPTSPSRLIASPTLGVILPSSDPAQFAASLRPSASWKAAQLPANFAWSPDGQTLAIATSQDVTLYEPSSGQVLTSHEVERSGNLQGIAWSPDGRMLAALGSDLTSQSAAGFILLLDPSQGLSTTETITAGNMLTQMAWSPDARTLAYTDGWQVYMWDTLKKVEVPKPVPTWPAPVTAQPNPNTSVNYTVNSLAWSPDGSRLALSQGGAVKITDPSTGKELLTIQVPTPQRSIQVVWRPDGGEVAALLVGDSKAGASTVMLWDAGTGKVLWSVPGGSRIAWSPYANVLAVGAGDLRNAISQVVLYHGSSGQKLGELPTQGQTVNNLAWSPDGRTLAVGNAANNTVIIYAVGSGPSPTPASLEPTITPLPTGVTPNPTGLPAPSPPNGRAAFLLAAVSNLRQVQMVDENNGWGLSAWGGNPVLSTALVRTADGGLNWSDRSPFSSPLVPITAGSGSALLDMHFLDASSGWVVSGEPYGLGVVVYYTTDGGHTWTGVTVPTRYLFVSAYADVSLDFVDSSFGWLMVWGAGGMSSTMGQLFATQDGGQSWQEIANSEANPDTGVGTLPFGGAVYLRDRSTGWVVGSQASTGPKQIYITHDSGKTWTEQKLSVADGVNPPVTLDVLAPPTVFAPHDGTSRAVLPALVSQDGYQADIVVFTSADGGDTWRASVSRPGSSPSSSFFLDAAHWWLWGASVAAAGKGAASPVPSSILQRTTDGDAYWTANGATWESLPSLSALEKGLAMGYQVSQLDFVNPQVGYYLLTSGSANPPNGRYAILLKTTDGGNSWLMVDVDNNGLPAPSSTPADIAPAAPVRPDALTP